MDVIRVPTSIDALPPRSVIKDGEGRTALRWTAISLVAAVWISAAIFGLYIVAFYFGAAFDGTLDQWNHDLPRLHDPQNPLATIGIGAHFAAGTILLLLGPVQLIASVRQGAPALHRWIGRSYASAALLAGLGGLAFILLQGTIGGPAMNAGFCLYGALTVIAALQTVRHARARHFELHRGWAIRLFALVIGSWLYRMDYGFWHLLAHAAGHTHTFDGPFDVVMDFFFFVPNLIVAEAFVRARGLQAGAGLRIGASVLLSAAALFVAVASYYFTVYHWGPAITKRLF
jgi:hypothetical protein